MTDAPAPSFPESLDRDDVLTALQSLLPDVDPKLLVAVFLTADTAKVYWNPVDAPSTIRTEIATIPILDFEKKETDENDGETLTDDEFEVLLERIHATVGVTDDEAESLARLLVEHVAKGTDR